MASLYVDAGWYNAWRATFEPQAQALLVIAESAEGLDGVFPLISSRVRRRPWFSMHHTHAGDLQRLGPKYRRWNWLPMRQLAPAACIDGGSIRGSLLAESPSHFADQAEVMLVELGKDSSWDVLVLPALEAPFVEFFKTACHRADLRIAVGGQTLGLLGMVPTKWEEYRASRTRHFRKRMAAAERDLAKLGDVESRTFSARDEVIASLESMFRLSERSWKARPKKHQKWWAPLDERPRDFLRRLAEEYAGSDRLGCGAVMHEVSIDGATAAMLFSIVFNNKLYAIQTFFDPEFGAGSPGRIVIKDMICWAAESDITWVDFNGNSSLVHLFAKDESEYNQVWIFNNTLRARQMHRLFRFVNGAMRLSRRTITRNSIG